MSPMRRNVYLKLTRLDEARRLWLDAFGRSPLGVEEAALAAAQGRTLAEPAAARLSSPAFHGAAMDGVAVAARDTFGATERRPTTLAIGREAHWINTGDPLPGACDAVVMIEEVVAGRAPDGSETVTLERAAFPWQHVRKMGEDMVATEIVLPAGTLVGAYEIGALAAAGVLRPVVWKRPLVAIVPSGSELRPVDEITEREIATGARLPEFNSLIVSAMVRDVGGEPLVGPIVPDEPDAIRRAILDAAGGPADLVAVIAGTSAGSRDFVPETIGRLGRLIVHGVSIMPGKPTALGEVEGKPALALPGYPVSAVVSFEQFGHPLLALWQGRDPPARPEVAAVPFQALPSKAGLEEHVRVKLGRVGGDLIAVPLPRGAGTVGSLSRADGVIRVPLEAEGLAADRAVPVGLLRSVKRIDGNLLAIGSHDNALELVDGLLRRRFPGRGLTSAHVGSLGGLVALRAGRCHLAGCHLLGPDGSYNRAAVTEHLSGTPVRLVRMADREQGLIVKPADPAGIVSLSCLVRPGVRLVNRQRGSGTRALLDHELGLLGIDPGLIDGYFDEEYTHMNVAAAVLSGRATVGLGVRSAAAALGLDFVPVGFEEYDLVIPESLWDDDRIASLLEVVRSDEFKRAAERLGGYRLEAAGEVVWTFGG